MNDLIKKIDNSQSFSNISLSDLKVKKNSIFLEDDGNVEIQYFNIALDFILNSDLPKPISDSTILRIIEETGKEFSKLDTAKTEGGIKIISSLRNFWRYKTNQSQSFELPNDMQVFDSIMSFYVKPFGFDQIERYMMNHQYTQKQYAFMLWAACKGYADLPKTFTNVLYESDSSNYIDNFLFDNFLNSETSAL